LLANSYSIFGGVQTGDEMLVSAELSPRPVGIGLRAGSAFMREPAPEPSARSDTGITASCLNDRVF